LKKGLARIAFEVEDQCDFKLGLKIVPTGIDYSSYDNVRGRLTVSFGDPITIIDLKDLYRQDPQAAFKELNNRIRTHIEPHMIEIPWEDIYFMVMDLRIIYGKRFRKLKNLPGKTLFNKFDSDKELIRLISLERETHPDAISRLNLEVMEYWKLLLKHNFRNHVPERGPYSFFRLFLNTLMLTIGFPIHLYALINNYHLYRIPAWISRKFFKDPQFRSTVAFVVSLVVMMPICYILQTLVIGLIFKHWWIWVPYFLTLLPTALYMMHYMFATRKWFSRLRYTWMMHKKHPDILRINELRKNIFNTMDHFVQ